MLWGHCVQFCCAGSFDFFENSVFRVIYSFHMPLFMLISGYLFFFTFQKRNLRDLLIHRTQSLLQPIIMCGILNFLLTDALFGLLRGSYTVILGGKWINHLRDCWFLWSVLSASLAVGIAFKVTNKIWVKSILAVLGIVFVALFPCMEDNIYMYPYFVIGFLYAKYKDRAAFAKVRIARYVSLIAFPVMMLFYKKEHYIYTSGLKGTEGLIRHMPVNLYRWAIGLVGSIFALTVLELIYKLIIQKMNVASIHLIEKLGEKSLAVYVLQCIFLSRYLPLAYNKLVDLLGSNILAQNMIVYSLFTFALAVGYSFALLLINHILEKMKISKVLFGR